jgi:hypothetical protein
MLKMNKISLNVIFSKLLQILILVNMDLKIELFIVLKIFKGFNLQNKK